MALRLRSAVLQHCRNPSEPNPGIGWSGGSTPCDAVANAGNNGPPRSKRLWDLSSATATTGTTDTTDTFDYGLVTEFWFGGGNASAVAYGTGCYGLVLAASARPLLGSTISLVTTAIPPATQLGTTVFSNVRHDPGLDLTSIGMAGCLQYVDLEVARIFLVAGSSGSVAQFIPNDPSFVGVQVHCQSATFSPGFNPLGVISSNGVTLSPDVR
jgi:hypothetical protein